MNLALKFKNYFNPRSHERSDVFPCRLLPTIVYFNPRSHERSDNHCILRIVYIKISIHAPTRGATVRSVDTFFINGISIHAPTRGATSAKYTDTARLMRFQSTLPREERHKGASTEDKEHKIFQSTLPREERLYFIGGINMRIKDFNPRSHERSDNPLSGLCLLAIIFQSTLPREERQNRIMLFMIIRSIFQSTLPREERHPLSGLCLLAIIFQSTLPREERHSCSQQKYIVLTISIHAPTRGATMLFFVICLLRVFQSTLPREERLSSPENVFPFSDFNPRSHERSDGKK